jgi:hypothetical protein
MNGSGVCGMRPGKISLTFDVHVTVQEEEVVAISVCAKECMRRKCTAQHLYIFLIIYFILLCISLHV